MPADYTPVPEAEIREGLELVNKATARPWQSIGRLIGSELRSFLQRGQRDYHLIGGHPDNDPDVPCIAAAVNLFEALALELLDRRKAMEEAPCAPDCATRVNHGPDCPECRAAVCNCWKSKFTKEQANV